MLIVVATLSVIVIFLKLMALLNSTKRTIQNAEGIASIISSKIIGPAMAGSGAAFGLGKALGFVFGFNKKQKQGKENGEQ